MTRRFSNQSSYGHKIYTICPGQYRLTWTVDKFVEGVRTRFPTGYSRDTDKAGAKRFAKKHGIVFKEMES